MLTGTVKWFNDSKGYGFIRRRTGDPVYVHHSAIVGSGYRTLEEGQTVDFEVQETDKGIRATHVICH